VVSGQAVSWSSSNTSVATVGSNGIVTAVNAGGATITATSDGVSTFFTNRFRAFCLGGKVFLSDGNLFCSRASNFITNHFEDTPREAVKAKTLAASLLLGAIFFEYLLILLY